LDAQRKRRPHGHNPKKPGWFCRHGVRKKDHKFPTKKDAENSSNGKNGEEQPSNRKEEFRKKKNKKKTEGGENTAIAKGGRKGDMGGQGMEEYGEEKSIPEKGGRGKAQKEPGALPAGRRCHGVKGKKKRTNQKSRNPSRLRLKATAGGKKVRKKGESGQGKGGLYMFV